SETEYTPDLRRILFIVIVLIVYGSLYPWQFRAAISIGNPLIILLHSWPVELNRFVMRDVVLNLLLYVPLGVFAYLTGSEHLRDSYALVAGLALALILSIGVEIAQLFEPARYASGSDVLCNFVGAGGGILAARLYQKRLTELLRGDAVQSLLRPSSAAMLLL